MTRRGVVHRALWTMDYGLWTMDYGLWTMMDSGLWTMRYAERTKYREVQCILKMLANQHFQPLK